MLQSVGEEDHFSAADTRVRNPREPARAAGRRPRPGSARPAVARDAADPQPLRAPRHSPRAEPVARTPLALGTVRQARADSRPRLWQRVDRALQFHQVECCAWTNDDAQRCRLPRGKRRVLRPVNVAHAIGTIAGWNIAAVLGGLRRSVLTPISAIWRPAFTRAA